MEEVCSLILAVPSGSVHRYGEVTNILSAGSRAEFRVIGKISNYSQAINKSFLLFLPFHGIRLFHAVMASSIVLYHPVDAPHPPLCTLQTTR